MNDMILTMWPSRPATYVNLTYTSRQNKQWASGPKKQLSANIQCANFYKTAEFPNLPAVKQLPLAAPKVEKTTNKGTIHDNGYSTLSPKVCEVTNDLVKYNIKKDINWKL